MTLAKERIAKGLCPRCGKEAAPYYLCADHRFEQQIVRRLNRGERIGGFRKEKRGRQTYWSLGSQNALDSMDWRDPKPDDKRYRPRLGRIPVEIEDELIKMLTDLGKPVTIDEILAAWGRLREKRSGGSVAQNMAAIIAADQRRQDRNARRLRAMRLPHAEG